MANQEPSTPLDTIHHVAVAVRDVGEALRWYRERFACRVAYQDETWAMLEFANVRLALVTPSEHPPHVAFTSPAAERFGTLCHHRDGTRSVYIRDADGNTIEILAAEGVAPGLQPEE